MKDYNIMTHCAISTFDNTLEEVCVIMSGNKDEKKQKKGKKNNSSLNKILDCFGKQKGKM